MSRFVEELPAFDELNEMEFARWSLKQRVKARLYFVGDVFVAVAVVVAEAPGSLRSNKVKSRWFKLHRANSISFRTSNAGNFFWS